MCVSDRNLLEELGLSQADLARAIETSRQAVNVGIQREEVYLNVHRLLMLHDTLARKQDRRATLVANILDRDHGVTATPITLDILGLELEPRLFRLISTNQSLRDYLRKIVSELIQTECDKFEGLFR